MQIVPLSRLWWGIWWVHFRNAFCKYVVLKERRGPFYISFKRIYGCDSNFRMNRYIFNIKSSRMSSWEKRVMCFRSFFCWTEKVKLEKTPLENCRWAFLSSWMSMERVRSHEHFQQCNPSSCVMRWRDFTPSQKFQSSSTLKDSNPYHISILQEVRLFKVMFLP